MKGDAEMSPASSKHDNVSAAFESSSFQFSKNNAVCERKPTANPGCPVCEHETLMKTLCRKLPC